MIKKNQGETDFEYKVRVCLAKLNKEIDLDWDEIVDFLDLDISGSHLRKLSYAYKEMDSYLKENQVTNYDDGFLEKIEQKKQELAKERQKLQATKIEYNKNLRLDSRFELLYENIKDSIKTIDIPEFKELFVPNSNNNKEYLMQMSDIHYGVFFKSENNEYSREICKQRFELLLSEAVKFIEKERINKLHIVNNADSIQGLLRISDVRMNDVPIVEATIEFSKLMSSFLNELSKYVRLVYYHVPCANHSELRLLGTKSGEMATEDLEKIIVNYIHDVLIHNNRITVPVKIDKGYIDFNLCGFDFVALHGHQIKNIKETIKDFSMLHKKFYSYALLGHYHSGQEISVGEGVSNNTEVLVAPSFVGSCPYADSLFLGAKSSVKIYTFEEENGHIQTNNIILN